MIQFHLEIFKHIKYIFTKFIQLKEQLQKGNESLKQRKQNFEGMFCKDNEVSNFEKMIFDKKVKMQTPFSLTVDKWNNMSVSE